MTPIADDLKITLTALKNSGNADYVAYAHNYLFEERVGVSRQEGYENDYPAKAGHAFWKNHHVGYVRNRIQIAGQIPETFCSLNRDAILSGLAENQYIVRIERLDNVLKAHHYDLTQLDEAVKKFRSSNVAQQEREDSIAWLEDFCNQWNVIRRDNRPAFAAFYDELEKDIESPDWANRIRNRLGLSHYQVLDTGNTIPIVLMRYRVNGVMDAVEETGRDFAFSVPTVLDGELNTHFFPSPREMGYGRTLNLEPDPDCENLVSEILHRRIDYQPSNFYKVGTITTPIPLYSLAKLRNSHLFCLHYEAESEDFGENIPENDAD